MSISRRSKQVRLNETTRWRIYKNSNSMGTNFIVSVKMPSENTQLISLKKSCFFKKDMGGYSQNCLICRDENLLIIHEKL